jgi:probable HAF family extracellular repeat protein
VKINQLQSWALNISFACFAVLLLSTLGAAQVYKITTIPTLGGKASFDHPNTVIAINNKGQTLGYSLTTAGVGHVGLWTPGSGVQDVGGSILVGALNNLGHIAGVYPGGGAFLWTPSAGFQNFGTGQFSATGINDLDQITGYYASTSIVMDHAFLWTAGSPAEFQDLGTLATSTNLISQGYGINESGQVVGVSQTGNRGKTAGFIWSNSTGMQATTLLNAVSINNDAQVLGSIAAHSSLYGHAAIWTQSSGKKDLGVLPGGTYSFATVINNRGFVIGDADGPDGKLYLYLWTPTGGMINVNTLVKRPGQSLGAIGMNDAGQIAAAGTDGQAYVLTPIIAVTDSSSHNPSTLGQPVTFTATASSIIGPPPDGEIITFKSSGAVIGTAQLVNGTATFTTSSLKAGSHTFSAVYPGDINYATSKSKTSTQVVNR